MYERLLVPTDGSDAAKTAARHGRLLAEAFGAELVLLSVVDDRVYSAQLSEIDSAVGEQRAAFEAVAEEALADLDTVVEDAAVPVTSEVRHGVPHEEIAAAVSETNIDLVAMGTEGRSGIDRLLLGSVTERIVRTVDVPVVTARAEAVPPDAGYDRVLLPTDGSENAMAAVEHGVAIAERSGASVEVLSVVDTLTLAGTYDAGPAIPAMMESLERRAERAVEAVAEACSEADLKVTTTVTHGLPYRAITDHVEERGIDLVAMGTQGRTGLDRVLLGSVTDRVLRTSPAPVLTVRG